MQTGVTPRVLARAGQFEHQHVLPVTVGCAGRWNFLDTCLSDMRRVQDMLV
jgi:hypothetical protein